MRSVRAGEADKEGDSDPAWFPVTSPARPLDLQSAGGISRPPVPFSELLSRGSRVLGREVMGDQPYIPVPREWQGSGDK